MRAVLILFTVFISTIITIELNAQGLSSWEKEQLENEYFNNLEYFKAVKNYRNGKIDSSRLQLKNLIQDFADSSNWELFIAANVSLLKTYQQESNYLEGIEFANQSFEKIKKDAPEWRKRSAKLVYNIGLTFPYPYEDKRALERFSYAKNLVVHSPSIDSLFLGEIYGMMGFSSLILKDYENSKKYLEKAQVILANHEYAKWCYYGWYPTVNLFPKSCDTIYQENGDYVIECVSSNPPYFSDMDDICRAFFYDSRNVYANLAAHALREKDLEKALVFLEKGADRMEFTYDGLEFVNLYFNFGKYYHEVFDYDRSNYFFKKVIQIINRSNTKNEYYQKEIIPECYYHIGTNYINIEKQLGQFAKNTPGQFNKTIIYLERALLPIKDHPKFKDLKIRISTSIANFYQLHHKDQKTIEEVFDYVNPLVKNSPSQNRLTPLNRKTKVEYNIVKANYLNKTNQPRKAIRLLKENLNQFPWNTIEIGNAKSHFHIAKIYHEIGFRDSALYHNQQALIAACENFTTPVFSKIPQLKDISSLPFVRSILLQKVNLLTEFARLQTNIKLKKKWLKHAIEIIDLVDNYHDEQVKEIKFLRDHKIKILMQDVLSFYLEGVAISFELFQMDNRNSTLEKGFYYSQKIKGQEITLASLNSKAESLLTNDQSFLAELRRINQFITKAERLIFHEELTTDTLLFDKIWLETEHLYYSQKEIEQLTKRVEEENPAYYQTKYQVNTQVSDAIQKIIYDDELIIEYIWNEEDLYIFTISSTSPLQLTQIPYSSQTSQIIHELNSQLSNSSMNRSSKRKKFISNSYQLYQQFLAPIEKQLKNKKRLIIIGDDQANYIPFEVLLKSNKNRRFKKLNYLIKEFEISYHYSASLFATSRTEPRIRNAGIYTFAPVYDNGKTSIAASNDVTIDLFDDIQRTFDHKGFLTPLPMSEVEVLNIMDIFNQFNPVNNRLDLREYATEASLKRNLRKPYQIIHIAGHSFANSKFPDYSGIACHENKMSIREDDILYTNEIYDLKIKADLITLSSCESGYGRNDRGEGLLGLNRAFIYSGTPNVIYSLWKVYDKTNAIVMVDLYKNIIKEEDYSSSLRKAKLNLLKREATASPHFWAPYLLIGR